MPSSRPRPGYLVDETVGGVRVAAHGQSAPIALAATESAAVTRAAADLTRDLAHVTGADTSLTAQAAGARIVVGTVGQSELVDAAVADGIIDISALRDDHGALRWEGFLITVADDVLYIVGADRRGTIYGIYEFTEAIGVSPWYWWGQVPVRTRAHVTVAADTHHADWPSVQYRGVFLNDEEELFDWARAHTADDTIGPEAYGRVYELILRLKGNYLWPAMHVGAFNHDPENGRLAQEFGIVIGTSHCDMLLRSNEHEFRPWVAQQGEPVEYDYSLPGRNRDKLREYWQQSVTQNQDYEVTWTVGMRGVHDTGFSTAAIDNNPALDEDQKFRARVELLETVITDQRELLSTTLGVTADTVPQLFIPYKEVLPLYDAGLQVPEDVTVVWANDNFGYIRRFPSEAERDRPGGHGLYYHSSYWSNLVTSYLATSSTPLALMKSELAKAWDRGIRKLWVDNIGGLKPLEIEMEFFLRSAWEAGREDRTADVRAFVSDWVDATFTGDHGAAAGEIYTAYYQLNNQRKIEHLTGDVFPQVGYGDEAFARLERFRDLYDRTNEILAALPVGERDAFFQLFAVKIHFAYLANAHYVYADRSTLAHAQGK
ncbi:MAG TPA: glycosyl hydrolase 115 family protein, partial [Microbacterium sp.]|nr:glycosyl hydrolase 115 family protein [Microbacterium sp.]